MEPANSEYVPENLDPHTAAPQELKAVFKSLRNYPLGDHQSQVVDFRDVDTPSLASIPLERYLAALQSFQTSTNVLQLEYEAILLNASTPVVPELGYVRITPKPPRTWDSRQAPSSLFDHIESYIRPQIWPNPMFKKPLILEQTKAPLVYHATNIPGLFVLPSLFTPEAQQSLLYCVLHRDLSDSRHQTNLHAHYDITYPPPAQSFFSLEKSAQICHPKDPQTHKPLTAGQVLAKKLKWITLGGQYDWTKKAYPDAPVPTFPPDIAKLIRDLFPEVQPEAAIVNVYSSGDTLSLHRDVSEESNCGLVSISLGCDAIFMIGLPNKGAGGYKHMAIRLKSGDALYMSGESRYAWHGLVKIFPLTCPEFLESWPGGPRYPSWMKDKRINISIRQMRADDSKR